MTTSFPVARLLVSVRDVTEARAAAAGGADIIDFKEPARGPLGRANFDVIAAAETALRQAERSPLPLLSAALGEVGEVDDWIASHAGHLPAGVAWLKLGLAGLGSTPNWIDEWLKARSAIEQRLQHPVGWVAVAYADVEAADAPAVDAVIEAAAETGCAGVLIDTCDKSGGRLLEHLKREQLAEISRRVRSRGQFFAVAGRLRASDLANLHPVGADIVAVRSAACNGDDRQTAVDRSRVSALRQQIRAIFADGACCGLECAAEPSLPTPTATAPAARSGD